MKPINGAYLTYEEALSTLQSTCMYVCMMYVWFADFPLNRDFSRIFSIHHLSRRKEIIESETVTWDEERNSEVAMGGGGVVLYIISYHSQFLLFNYLYVTLCRVSNLISGGAEPI